MPPTLCRVHIKPRLMPKVALKNLSSSYNLPTNKFNSWGSLPTKSGYNVISRLQNSVAWNNHFFSPDNKTILNLLVTGYPESAYLLLAILGKSAHNSHFPRLKLIKFTKSRRNFFFDNLHNNLSGVNRHHT